MRSLAQPRAELLKLRISQFHLYQESQSIKVPVVFHLLWSVITERWHTWNPNHMNTPAKKYNRACFLLWYNLLRNLVAANLLFQSTCNTRRISPYLLPILSLEMVEGKASVLRQLHRIYMPEFPFLNYESHTKLNSTIWNT